MLVTNILSVLATYNDHDVMIAIMIMMMSIIMIITMIIIMIMIILMFSTAGNIDTIMWCGNILGKH